MIEYKEDCFAIRGSAKIKKCVALNVINCRKCNFYKTYEQHLEDLKKYPWNEYMRRVSADSIYKPPVKEA